MTYVASDPPPPDGQLFLNANTNKKNCSILCYFIIAIVQKQPTYFKDTPDFINKIESLELMRDRSVMMLPVSYKHGV